MQTNYQKTPITINDQIHLLQERGLIINNLNDCKEFLTNISYYRLSWYFKAYQNNNQFIAGTRFSTVKEVYILDQKLRNIIAEAIERIEVALRARIVNVTCCSYKDALWHINNDDIQNIVKKRIRKQDVNCPFKHYDKKYCLDNNEHLEYPFWLISELFFFSDLSLMFKQALKSEHQQIIAQEFQLRPYHFGSYLHTLSILRNTAAHHDKIFKRQFAVKPKGKYLIDPKQPFHQYNYFINHYYIICHLLSVIHPNNTWKQRVDKLLENKDIAYGYGFPKTQ